jgi:hypothetical protein
LLPLTGNPNRTAIDVSAPSIAAGHCKKLEPARASTPPPAGKETR